MSADTAPVPQLSREELEFRGGPGPYVEEIRLEGPIPLLTHPQWARSFPWLVQGITTRGVDDDFDLRLSGDTPVGVALGRWAFLREELGFPRIVHAHQVHGRRVIVHRGEEPAGFTLVAEGDGHVTDQAGILLTVSAADCIPISLVDPIGRAVALLHGGWRGVAAGILESGIDALKTLASSEPGTLFLHLGPAICGACYEVGPEVYEALGLERPESKQPIDLRAVVALRAERLGLHPARITRSVHCTRCSESPFYSHRRGESGRQVAILGVRGADEEG